METPTLWDQVSPRRITQKDDWNHRRLAWCPCNSWWLPSHRIRRHTEATVDHDKNLSGFLQRAREKGLKLNGDNIKLCQPEVSYIGHLLTAEGLKPDPAKVEALLTMPQPEDLRVLKRFLGMVQYLNKFLPSLSNATHPLRELERQDVAWKWTASHDAAFGEIKHLIANAPVLHYFDPELEVTKQADACKDGLQRWAALMQGGQPVSSCASRAMTTSSKTKGNRIPDQSWSVFKPRKMAAQAVPLMNPATSWERVLGTSLGDQSPRTPTCPRGRREVKICEPHRALSPTGQQINYILHSILNAAYAHSISLPKKATHTTSHLYK